MIRAVIAPDVLVSAFISRRGSSPDRIVRAWRAGAFELVVSPKLLAELTDVLPRPKFAPQAAVGRADAYVAALAADANRLDGSPDPPSVSPDADDDYLFGLARAARADAIVSGDRHLTGLRDPHSRVMTPPEFMSGSRKGDELHHLVAPAR